METIQSWVTLIKDIITGLAALTAAIIAVIGLQTWKKQLKGKTEYELAQRLLRSTYKVREAMTSLRNPLPIGTEIQMAMNAGMEEGKQIDNPKVYASAAETAYYRRWQSIQEALGELEAVSLEAEAIWGEVVKKNLNPLKQCNTTLLGLTQN